MRKRSNIVRGNFGLRDPNPTEESQRGSVWGRVVGAIYQRRNAALNSRIRYSEEQGLHPDQTELGSRVTISYTRGRPRAHITHFWKLR